MMLAYLRKNGACVCSLSMVALNSFHIMDLLYWVSIVFVMFWYILIYNKFNVISQLERKSQKNVPVAPKLKQLFYDERLFYF